MADGESTNFRDLLQLVEQALYSDTDDVDCAAFLQALQRAKPAFLNLLRYKVGGWRWWGRVWRSPAEDDRSAPLWRLAQPPSPPTQLQQPPHVHRAMQPRGMSPQRRRRPYHRRRCCCRPPPQEPNAESRAAVQGGKPLTPAGPVVLDPEPDIREVGAGH